MAEAKDEAAKLSTNVSRNSFSPHDKSLGNDAEEGNKKAELDTANLKENKNVEFKVDNWTQTIALNTDFSTISEKENK